MDARSYNACATVLTRATGGDSGIGYVTPIAADIEQFKTYVKLSGIKWMHRAATNNCPHAVFVELISIGLSVDEPALDGSLPLFLAAKHHAWRAFAALCDLGADTHAIDIRGETLLMQNGLPEMVFHSLSSIQCVDVRLVSNDGNTALHQAVVESSRSRVTSLLLRLAHVDAVRIGSGLASSETPLVCAVTRRVIDHRIVSLLLAHGANPNFGSPMARAIEFVSKTRRLAVDDRVVWVRREPTGRRLDALLCVLDVLVQNGADVNQVVRVEAGDSFDYDPPTVLSAAIATGSADLVKAVIRMGASLDHAQYLRMAATSAPVMEQLLAGGITDMYIRRHTRFLDAERTYVSAPVRELCINSKRFNAAPQ